MSNDIKYKTSKYNHFVENSNGKVLAFNAMSRFLGRMDKEDYELYRKIAGGELVRDNEIMRDLLEKLKRGNFLIPETTDEIQKIKARHYMSRFSNQGFGLTIIPTLECNFACDYCYEPGNPQQKRPKREPMSKEVQDGVVEIVKSRLPEGTEFGVSWYGGEPLLGLEVIESLTERFKKVCEEKKAKYAAGIITNGYLLTPETLDKLLKLNIAFAQVTIDGPEEIHNERRPLAGGGPTYQAIMHNLERIPEDIHFSVSIRINIDKRNRECICGFLRELKERNFHKRKNMNLSFSQVVAENCGCKDIKENCFLTREFAAKDLNLHGEAVKLGFKIHDYPGRSFSGCAAIGSNYFTVEPDGGLHACWETVGRKEMRIGKMEDSVLKLNDNYNKWLSYSPFEKKGCLDCSVLPMCMGGCPYRSIYGGQFSPQQRNTCSLWKYNIEDRMKFYVEAYRMGLFVPTGSEPGNNKVRS
jgi:uncharacterized protein